MINNDNFKIKEFPTFHPIIDKYARQEWWRIHKRRIFEGYWVGGKWIPGELYYYINFHKIIVEDGIYRNLALPWYRDLEDIKAYIYTEAIGFSGFELDHEVTCHRDVKRALDGEITKEQLVQLVCPEHETIESQKKMYESIFKSNGELKKYEPARDYLPKIHKGNLGKPLYYNQAKHLMDLESRGGGKDLHKDTIVHGENGPIKIADVEVGSKIYGRDGKLTTVLSKKEYNDQLQYKVTTKDGRSLIAGGGHLWGVIDRYGKSKTVDTQAMFSNYKTIRKGNGVDYHYFLPMCKPMQYDEKELPIEPYFLGLWLGDGSKHRVGITTPDEYIVDYIYDYADRLNLKVTINQNANKTCPTYFMTEGVGGNHKREFHCRFKNLDLINNKHIPEIYQYASIEQRMELLRGLMDSDGHCGDKGQMEFSTSNDKIYNGFIRLIDGLGIKNNSKKRITKCNGKEFEPYRVNMTTSLPVFKLEKKLCRINNNPSKYALANREKTAIVDIKPLSVMPSVCIGVDNEDKLFVAGERFLVTHNSFSGSGYIAHNYITDGLKDYDYWLECKRNGTPLKSETGVGAIDAKFSSDLLSKVKQSFSSYFDSHVLKQGNDFVKYPSPLYVPYSGSFMAGKSITADFSKSQIQHRTLQDNSLAFNGTRPNRVFLEEVGFITNILEAWEAIEATQASAQFKRLSIIGFGTGGLTSGGAAMHVHEIFYNPEAYGCLVFDDIWENKGNIGMFIPGELTLNAYKYGPNKKTDVDAARKAIEKERDEARKSPTRTKLMGVIINKPQVPSEVFLRAEGSLFPTQDLKSRLAEIESNKYILEANKKVQFDLISGKVVPKTTNKPPIREFPLLKGMDMDGCIEIFEDPKKDPQGNVFFNRYIAGWDVVENDGNENTSRSLQSMFIMDLWTERLVAEYSARTYLATDYYEQARRLLIYYNAKCNYESNIKGPYGYFKNKNSLHLLVETPEILKDQNLVKGSTIGNKALGTNTNHSIITWGLNEYLQWLEGDAYDQDEGVRNLDTIKSPALLKESISYTPDINADRVSSMIMLMILKADLARVTQVSREASVKTKAKDSFWNRAYNK